MHWTVLQESEMCFSESDNCVEFYFQWQVNDGPESNMKFSLRYFPLL